MAKGLHNLGCGNNIDRLVITFFACQTSIVAMSPRKSALPTSTPLCRSSA